MALHVQTLVTGELEENCFLLWQDTSASTLVFDPGADGAQIVAALKQRQLTPAAFMLTHCHFDHIGGLPELKSAWPQAPIYVPEAEAQWLRRPTLNLSYFFNHPVTAPEPDVLVKPDSVIDVGGFTLRAIHVPGHSPGGTAYFVDEPEGTPHLFCGDILFHGGIGRTDFPGSAGQAALVGGIREKLFILPENTAVHAGHGADSTIGEERENNPFCAAEE